MKRLWNIIGDQQVLLKSILINLLVFLGLLLFFEPTLKVDDSSVSNILYGGTSGQYCEYILYSNVLLGLVLKGLLTIFPNIVWYVVFQWIFLLISFSLVTYYVLCENSQWQGVLLSVAVVLPFGYETYIRFTFTKTAAILIGAGLFAIFKYFHKRRKNHVGCIIGVVLFLVGSMWRYKTLYMMLAFFVMAVGMDCLFMLIKEHSIRKIVLKYWKCALLIAVLCISALGIKNFNGYYYRENPEWSEYLTYNSARVKLDDYGWPAYYEYYDEYQALGISKNDYAFWRNLSYDDDDVIDVELMTQIAAMKEVKAKSIKTIVSGFLKNVPGYFLTINAFYFFAFIAYLFLINKRKNKKLLLLSDVVVVLALYLSLYYSGRYQKQHVDVGIWFGACTYLCVFMERTSYNLKNAKKTIGGAALLTVLFLCTTFYENLTSSSYYGTDHGQIESAAGENDYKKTVLDLFSKDEEHMYTMNGKDGHNIFFWYSTTEVIPKGFYHNIFLMGKSYIPAYNTVLENYDLDNLFRDMGNNEAVYYVSTDSNVGQLEKILIYIQEHYYPEAYYTLVKRADNVNIYRYNSGSLTVDTSDSKVVDDSFIYDITGSQSQYYINVSGYIYKPGQDSFSQNLYLQFEDKETGEKTYYYTFQTENDDCDDKLNGKYSSVSASIPTDAVKDFSMEKYNVTLLYEDENETYTLPVQVSAEQ